MSINYNLQTDLDEAKAMANTLEDYVRGTELYGYADGNYYSDMSSLTVGSLLMHLRRLDNMRDIMNDSQRQELDQAQDTWQAVRKEWNVHYVQQVKREAESRLDAMQPFFDECSENMMDCQQNYRPELLRRTIVQELFREIRDLKLEAETLKSKVHTTDVNLHHYLSEDIFQWASDLQAIYPKEGFCGFIRRPS